MWCQQEVRHSQSLCGFDWPLGQTTGEDVVSIRVKFGWKLQFGGINWVKSQLHTLFGLKSSITLQYLWQCFCNQLLSAGQWHLFLWPSSARFSIRQNFFSFKMISIRFKINVFNGKKWDWFATEMQQKCNRNATDLRLVFNTSYESCGLLSPGKAWYAFDHINLDESSLSRRQWCEQAYNLCWGDGR